MDKSDTYFYLNDIKGHTLCVGITFSYISYFYIKYVEYLQESEFFSSTNFHHSIIYLANWSIMIAPAWTKKYVLHYEFFFEFKYSNKKNTIFFNFDFKMVNLTPDLLRLLELILEKREFLILLEMEKKIKFTFNCGTQPDR